MTVPAAAADVAPEKSLTPDSDQRRLDELRATVALLRDQVDVLQIQASARARPWYHEAGTMTSLVTSLLALAVSVGLAVWANQKQAEKDASDRSEREQVRLQTLRGTQDEQLRRVTADLVNLRVEESSAGAAATTPAAQQAHQSGSGLRNFKRQVLLEQADTLVRALGASVSGHILNTLASEEMMDARFDKARRYWSAVDARTTDSTLARVAAAQSLANLHSIPGTALQDERLAHHYWSKAETLLASRRDEYAKMQRVWLHGFHLNSDVLAGWTQDRARTRQHAEDAWRALSPLNPGRSTAAQQLAQLFAFSDTAGSSRSADLPVSPQALVGTWRMTLAGAPGLRATLVVTPGVPDPSSLMIWWSATEGGRLVRKAAGTGRVVGGNLATFDWTGQVPVPAALAQLPAGAPTPVAVSTGTLELRVSRDGRIAGELRTMGEGPVAVVATRARPD